MINEEFISEIYWNGDSGNFSETTNESPKNAFEIEEIEVGNKFYQSEAKENWKDVEVVEAVSLGFLGEGNGKRIKKGVDTVSK